MQNLHQFEAGYILNSVLQGSPNALQIIGIHFSSYFYFSILLVLVTVLVVVFRRLISFLKSLNELTVFLELTPPAFTEKSAYTTEQLFSLIHSLGSQRTIVDRLLGYRPIFSLEISSTQNQGIRYLVRVPTKDASTFRKSLLSYLPQIAIKSVGDYLPTDFQSSMHTRVMEFKLSNHFAFPLKKQDELGRHDPIAYITGMMTKLSPGEIVSLQIIIAPTRPPEVNVISSLVMRNGDVIGYLRNAQSFSSTVLSAILGILYSLYSIPFQLVTYIASNGTTYYPNTSLGISKKDSKTSYEQELTTSIYEKINQPLFETTLRVLLSVHDHNNLSERIRGLRSSFTTSSVHNYQSIVSARMLNLDAVKRFTLFTFKMRLFSITNKSLFSVSEVSDLYHFPYTRITKTEDLVKVHSKELPAPLALKKTNNLNLVFAKNTYGGTTTMIGLTEEERRRHMYILGATGTGKSTLLLSMINQDILNGKGVCIIDPHGDLAEKILPLIPEERIKDVIYFNPDDIGHPIGINLLELSQGLNEEDALREKEFITESIISLFHKIYSDKYSGPRMEYILRNTIHTAFTVPNRTLFTVYKLLINTPFRKQVTAGLTDENLKDFWKYEFNKAGDYQKVKMISPITNKIGRFLFSPTAKRILEQEKSTINFDKIMDSGKILIGNLSKGRIGEDNSEVFGIVLMTKIQLAALKRARVNIENRRDFYLYVDEFQNFATPAFAQILSEARKYRLSAILAHQTTSQLEDKSLVNVTLANTGTVICFRTANPEDEQLILPQFYPYVQQGEIASLPSYHFYIKINAINPEEPFSGETIQVQVPKNKQIIEEVISSSRFKYATTYKQPADNVSKARVVKKTIISKPAVQQSRQISQTPVILP